MTSKIVIKGKYDWVYSGIPIEVEWDLPIEYFEDVEVFEKIGEEMRRIAWTLKKQMIRERKRRLNLYLQNVAIENLRWLFMPRPQVVEVKP